MNGCLQTLGFEERSLGTGEAGSGRCRCWTYAPPSMCSVALLLKADLEVPPHVVDRLNAGNSSSYVQFTPSFGRVCASPTLTSAVSGCTLGRACTSPATCRGKRCSAASPESSATTLWTGFSDMLVWAERPRHSAQGGWRGSG